MQRWSLFWLIVKNFLPYPDLTRRHRVRRDARRLVTCRSLSHPVATGPELAQVALLRLLWLQRLVRRSVRWGQSEASGMLARACLDTCLTGLYCLYVPDAPTQIDAQSLHSLNKLFAPLSDPAVFPPGLLKSVVTQLGVAKPLPTVRAMAEAVSSETGERTALDLYHRLYDPLSMLFVHSGAMALGRHVDPRNRVHDGPLKPWTNLAALRTADACLGILASAVAKCSGSPSDHFVSYAERHRERALIPLVVVFLRSARRSVDWAGLLRAYPGVREFGRYYRSGQAAAALPSVREAQLREVTERFLVALNPHIEPRIRDLLVDALIKELADFVPTPQQGQTARGD